MEVILKNIKIGDKYDIQLIGEIGQNHNGDIEMAKKLIDICNETGIKLIKFQKRDIKNEFTPEEYNREYNSIHSYGKTYGEHREFLEFSKEQHIELKKYCDDRELIYFCTACDINSLKMCEEIGCPFYKVASRDITNIPLLQELGKLNKTVIISTGMANYDDIELCLKTLNLHDSKVIIMQCTSNYPCLYEDVNLNVIKTFKKKYNNVIGFSDHTQDILSAVIAGSLGANIIEKHITLDKNGKGSDHRGSSTKEELMLLNKYLINIKNILGNSEKKLLDSTILSKKKLMKSLTTNKYLMKNQIITYDDICLKCPGDGILYKDIDKIINKKCKIDLEKDIKLDENYFY